METQKTTNSQNNLEKEEKNWRYQDFPGGPVVKTTHFQ